MKVVFAHPEPIDPGRARWVAIVRSLAAVAIENEVVWYTPDTRATVQGYARNHLGLELPEALRVETLPSVHKRMGLTINNVFFRTFRQALKKSDAEVLWLRSDKLAQHVAHKAKQIPLVYEAHLIGAKYASDKGESNRRANRRDELERDIYRHASGVAAITDGLLDEIRKSFAYDGPGAVVPSAVDTFVFQPVWNGSGKTVVYVGTLMFWKGLGTLLEAIKRTDLKLRIIGSGKPEQKRRLEEEIERLGIRERIEFTGHVAQMEIPNLVKDAGAAVHPLPSDANIAARFTSPLKVMEYLAMGLPIVAADVPSVREVLNDGENARLYEAGNADALGAALQEVCGRAELARSLSDKAKKTAGRYTYAVRAEKLMALFAAASASRLGAD